MQLIQGRSLTCQSLQILFFGGQARRFRKIGKNLAAVIRNVSCLLFQLQKESIAQAANTSIEEVEDIISSLPTDLMTASGSGLDPHISPASADIQVPRIAEASGLSEEEIREIISRHTGGKVLGIFGEDTVNVLEVNIEIGQAMGLLGSEE